MKKAFDIPDYVIKIITLLNKAGYEAWIVGGAVRSMLLGIPVHDYDITTSAYPSETKEVFNDYRIIDTGIRHGTVTVLVDHHPVEITTYRTETSYHDHRHPDSVRFTRSLQQDCARRDFTINAICYHPQYGLKDFYGGTEDLRCRIIRAIGSPQKRFEEDALRILRAVRFSAQLDFTIEPETAEAVSDHCSQLCFVSEERINEELSKTISAPYFKDMILKYKTVFTTIIPPLSQYTESQWNSVQHAAALSDNDAVIRMAVLLSPLNDLHKAESVLKGLKYPSAYIHDVLDLLQNQNLPAVTRVDIRWILNQIHVSFDTWLSYRASIDPSIDKEKIMNLYQQIQRDHDCYELKTLAVNGTDCLAAGYSGKEISRVLHDALSAVIEDKIPNSREQLLAYITGIRKS